MGKKSFWSKLADYAVPDAIYDYESGEWLTGEGAGTLGAGAGAGVGFSVGGPLGALVGAGIGGGLGTMWEASGDDVSGKIAAAKAGAPANPQFAASSRPYMDRLWEMAGRAPGEGYMQSPLYRGLMSDVEQQGRQMGWANSAQQGRSGIMSGAGYGPGQQQATERMEAVGRLQQQAGRQAWEAQVQADAQEFDRVLKSAGFHADLLASDWEAQFRTWAKLTDLTLAEIEATVERRRMMLDFYGNLATVGVLSGLLKGGGGGGGDVGGSGPGGGRTGFLPSSVG